MVITPDHLKSRPGPGPWLVVTPLTGRVGLRLVGEIDLLNADVLAQAIAMLPPEPPEIHFQLSGLEFIDLQGTRELIKLAIVPKRLVLRHPPPTLLRIITLVWPDVREQIVTAATRPGTPSPVEQLESPEPASADRASDARSAPLTW